MSRLEEIKEWYAYNSNNDWKMMAFEKKHIVWLIKQAERVKELEEENRIQMSETHKNLDKVIYLDKKNKRYKQALEFYADRGNYEPIDGIFLSDYQNKVDKDGGEKARQALKGESE